MKRLPFFFAGVLLAFAPAAIAEDKPAATSATASEIRVASAIENREPAGAADHFELQGDMKIWVWTRVRDVAPGSSIAIVFRKGETERFRKELSVPQVPYRTNAYRTFRKGDDGEWTAAVLSSDGKELASAKFTVTAVK